MLFQTNMEKIIKVSPAYDKRDTNPNINYGIGEASMFFVLKGDLGAVVFSLFTGWFLPHNQEELYKKDIELIRILQGRSKSLCYCSPKPLEEYQLKYVNPKCEWLDVPCYGDCSYCDAEEVFRLLVAEGSDAVWTYLEKFYMETFSVLR